ncbi:MAG TPA: hypothetical protein VGW96_03550 [Candidatus Eremiobacteraceae bacterium]|nr:hypothetical protein [Candidatus Eremiobacteraceae bacterium]
MQLGMMPVMRAALDPIAFFVIAIIVFNIIATIAKSLKKAVGSAASAAETSAKQRLSQALQTASSPDQISAARAARAAELAKLRSALLASAGVSNVDAPGPQSPLYMAVSQPPPAATPATVTSALLTAAAARLSGSRVVAPAAPSAPPAATPAGWSLESAGTLMTLESSVTAFDRLGALGSALATAQNAALGAPRAPGNSLAVLDLPNVGANLFVAAAIVGPCAAFRSLGHTPGGW